MWEKSFRTRPGASTATGSSLTRRPKPSAGATSRSATWRRDEEGFYYLVDRKKDMIISGGENLYQSEVENLLGAHPKVKDVAVIGRPDATWGETVHAVIVLRNGAVATEREILDWCIDRIAGYKRPRSRTATGKIQHRILRDRISAPG